MSVCCRFDSTFRVGYDKVFVFRMMEGVVPTLANNLNVGKGIRKNGAPRTEQGSVFLALIPYLYDSEQMAKMQGVLRRSADAARTPAAASAQRI